MTLLLRRPQPGQHSVERIFETIRHHFPPDVRCESVVVPHRSQGFVPRVKNLLFTARLDADVVHVTGDITYCALAVRRKRCVVTVLDLVSIHRLRGWRRRLLIALWYRAPLRWARSATVISPAVRDELACLVRVPPENFTVIGCPVGVGSRPGAAQERDRSLPRVLQIGTGANKNLERVAEAVSGLDVELRIVGRPSARQIDDLDRLGVHYSVVSSLSDDEMTTEYQQAAVLAYVSTYEGFGMPIIEAQACGTPVVTTHSDPTAWVAGPGAVLVDPYDPGEIREALKRVIGDDELRTHLVGVGHGNVQRFRAEDVAEQYASVYRAVVADRS